MSSVEVINTLCYYDVAQRLRVYIAPGKYLLTVVDDFIRPAKLRYLSMGEEIYGPLDSEAWNDALEVGDIRPIGP
jgi:hypothetical protein